MTEFGILLILKTTRRHLGRVKNGGADQIYINGEDATVGLIQAAPQLQKQSATGRCYGAKSLCTSRK